MSELTSTERVVVVGGSISGLTLALALQAAKIDFIVLERGLEIGPQLGASTGCHPHGQNIFHQLGIFQAIDEIGIPIALAKTFDGTGRCIEDNITVTGGHIQRLVVRIWRLVPFCSRSDIDMDIPSFSCSA
jgi:2-polyprenyl-6-methoxyphenol hydroxylase-like FAD-dependent oxidoreductase